MLSYYNMEFVDQYFSFNLNDKNVSKELIYSPSPLVSKQWQSKNSFEQLFISSKKLFYVIFNDITDKEGICYSIELNEPFPLNKINKQQQYKTKKHFAPFIFSWDENKERAILFSVSEEIYNKANDIYKSKHTLQWVSAPHLIIRLKNAKQWKIFVK